MNVHTYIISIHSIYILIDTYLYLYTIPQYTHDSILWQCDDNQENTMFSWFYVHALIVFTFQRFLWKNGNHLIHKKYGKVPIVDAGIKNIPPFAKDSTLVILNIGFIYLKLVG